MIEADNMEKKVFKVSSLTEYIDLIQHEKLGGCIFRGENQNYNGIKSSLIRNYNPQKSLDSLSNIYNMVLKSYYQEIGSEINELQKEYFIAFSQHHGLKTNLIDFTTAPLIALYFACEGIKDYENTGYVYTILNQSFINATSLIDKYCFKSYWQNNLYDLLTKFSLRSDFTIVNEYKTILEDYDGSYTNEDGENLFKKLFAFVSNKSYTQGCSEFIEDYKKALADGSIVDKVDRLILKYFPNFDISGTLSISNYMTLLLLFLEDINDFPYVDKPDNEIVFPPAPYLVYKTPLKFDRIRNQNGVFIYQGFIDIRCEYDEYSNIAVQEIIPDITFEIINQQKILNELDLVGINKRYVYGDFDNTARYINEKYFNI